MAILQLTGVPFELHGLVAGALEPAIPEGSGRHNSQGIRRITVKCGAFPNTIVALCVQFGIELAFTGIATINHCPQCEVSAIERMG
jgi:hypothetical protein